MRNDPTRGRRLKQQLPYPYNQDLSKVLRGLKRRNPITRSRQANDPVTAAYLAAAARLIQRHLGPGARRLPGDADDADSIERPLLGFLSQRAAEAEGDPVIAEAMSERHQETPRCGNTFMKSSSAPAACACGRGSRSMTASSCWLPSRMASPCGPWPIPAPLSSITPGGAACSERPPWP